MGFFKKITRPLSRVLDKIIPNEIKPALPYLSAAAPYLLGPGSGTGIMSNILSNPYYRSALTGSINLGSQLAQEGSEGDFSTLSLGLAGLQGALTTPDAATKFKNLQQVGTAPDGSAITAKDASAAMESSKGIGQIVKPDIYGSGDPGVILGSSTPFKGPPSVTQLGLGSENISSLAKLKNAGLRGLSTGAEYASDLSSTLRNPLANLKETAKAAFIPATQGSMDLAYAQTNRLNKQSIIDDALGGLTEGFSNSDASDAIRLSMLRYGFSEDEISETIVSAGYKAGGRVGFDNGGIMNAKRGLVDAPGGYAGIEEEEVEFGGITEAVENVKEDKQRAYMELLDTASIDREADLRMEKLNNLIEEGMSEDEAFKLVMPNAFSNDGKTDSEGRPIEVEDKIMIEAMSKAKGGIIGLNMGGSVLPSGREMDYRQGGMIPMGSKERADDVPARLSKNEFVMTADAVRAAGGGSVNQGAKRMYNLMNNLEAKA